MTNKSIQDIPQKELANCIGATVSFASQIQRGTRKLPVKHCKKVSETFGIPISILRSDLSAIFEGADQ